VRRKLLIEELLEKVGAPTIYDDYGIRIEERQDQKEHGKSHYHVFYGGKEGRIYPETGKIKASFSPPQIRRLKEWLKNRNKT